MQHRLYLIAMDPTGRDLFRVALFNYLCHLNGDLSPQSLAATNAAFPNTADLKSVGTAPCRQDLLPAPFIDFVQGTSPSAPWSRDNPKAVLFLVRNPLDTIVTSWLREQTKEESEGHSLQADTPERLRSFRRTFSEIQALRNDRAVHIIHYETLRASPEATLSSLLSRIGMEINSDLITLATRHAEKSLTTEILAETPGWAMERASGPQAVKTPDGIGLWRSHFEEDDLELLDNMGLGRDVFDYGVTKAVGEQ